MKVRVLCILVAVSIIATTAFAQSPDAKVDELGWLSGCWRTELEGTMLEEHWSEPAGGTLVGFSRGVEQNRTVFIEFSTIHTAGEDIFYTATIVASGQSTPFKLIRSDSVSVTFADPEHDFPQTIVYQIISADELLVQLQGEERGEVKSEAYVMRRMDCR